MSKPLLSIGMIFRDDIRSLERCMQALRPLREAVPCELIMADTGSVDASREIAAQYADVLFDFPWTDDFSAARNAVMDRACGKWYLTVDCDEYLDGDFSELLEFLRSGTASRAMVVQRNYVTAEMDGRYSDCWAGRLVRMSAGLRYQGRIHEHFPAAEGQPVMLARTILHHDGYVEMNEGRDQRKRARNVALLRASLAQEPENLRYLMQLIESGREEPDYLEIVRRASALVEEKKPGWQEYGPALFRHAVFAARQLGLPELDGWIERAETWFPDSFFTRIDVEHTAFIASWERADWPDCVRRGERFLAAKEDYRAGGDKSAELMSSTLIVASPDWERSLRILLSIAFLRNGCPEQAWTLLEKTDGRTLDAGQTKNLTLALLELHAQTNLETGLLVLKLYDELLQPVPSQAQAGERRAAFWKLAAGSFTRAYRDGREERCRPGCTLFAPLAGQHEAAAAAAILKSTNGDDAARLLHKVERWDELPVSALEHAIRLGVCFPLPDRPLKWEEMDALAGQMADESLWLASLAVQAAERMDVNWQSLMWAWDLVLAAVQACGWKDQEEDYALCRAFARAEHAALPRYYGAELFCEENLSLLPPLHRFGWYCARAFEALDSGDSAEYVRLLRAGLAVCEGVKDMVEFLTKHTPGLQAPAPSAELLALAEQVRTILAAYDPDDPAVAALKASPVYQKVAYLIEGADAGGLPS